MVFPNGFLRGILAAALLGLPFLGSVLADLASDRAALVGFRAAMGGRPRLEWNISEVSPCSWAGVSCGKNGVFELRLPAMGLSGELPVGLGNLTQLQTLSLRFNALSGRIPADFANLRGLRNLYLQGNLFSGEIPAFLFDLKNLVRLNMADNKFSGEISSGFNNLSRLATLYLQNNQFTGVVPELNLHLEQFNVSFNRLNGSIPSKLSGFPASVFEGNLLCGAPLLLCNSTETTEPGRKSKLSGGTIAGIVIGGLFVLVLILVVLILVCQRKRKGKLESNEGVRSAGEVEAPGEKAATVEGSSESINIDHLMAPKSVGKGGERDKRLVFFGNVGNVFDLEDLLRASAEVLGKGTFGTAYKATLETGMVVAVKRLKEMTSAEKEFKEKIEEVGRMKHENLVPLRAYYYSREEKLLVYDYMPMGSLSALLHGSSRESGRTPLNWEARCGIALGVSQGIHYLHSQGPTISHGNIKSSNLLLTQSYEARVSDFGLAQLAMSPSAPSRVAGYRAPEVTDSRKVSQKADIYSFGVLLLEMLTGKPPTHSIFNEEAVDLPRWVQSVVQEEWTAEVFDEQLLRYQNVEEEMVQLLELALQCTVPYPDNRPEMDEIVRRIEELCRSSSQKQNDESNGISTPSKE
ncbi:probable inactive receptor kinase At1g48480 [Cucurbita pepo subsp. pepo]|uniref:probable inactive receptor kinase At1g48480 n=1 Tax=Cucurbita pepo subsp. pepo TaxID=3664 RepID=UPI000C9D26C7|nr:probable inactive receptor kinase At1g48480 [Cucurbita pepo subsp. pepo]